MKLKNSMTSSARATTEGGICEAQNFRRREIDDKVEQRLGLERRQVD